jgi:hypothetical protein
LCACLLMGSFLLLPRFPIFIILELRNITDVCIAVQHRYGRSACGYVLDTYPVWIRIAYTVDSIRKKTNMNKPDTWPGTYWATISHYGVRLGPARRRRERLNIVGDLRMRMWLRGWEDKGGGGAADSAVAQQPMCSHGHQRRNSERDRWSGVARRPGGSSGEREERCGSAGERGRGGA